MGKKEIFIKEYRESFVIEQALRKSGLTRKELESTIQKDEDFKAIIEETEKAKNDFLKARLLNQAKEGNVSAAIYLIEKMPKTENTNKKWHEI